MGLESKVEATFNGRTASGKARLEAATLEFRSDAFKLIIPFAQIENVVARDGCLTIAYAAGEVALALGSAAPKWAAKIHHPRSRLDKIGVKPDWNVAVIGSIEKDFLDELAPRVAKLSVGRVLKQADAVFYAATSAADLRRLSTLKSSIQPAGAIWVIRPKGGPAISERAVMAAGKAAGLVDVKVVGFSTTHSALKFVIPVKDRDRC